MNGNPALDPPTILAVPAWLAYALLFCVALLSRGPRPLAKWLLALYFATAFVANAGTALPSVAFLRDTWLGETLSGLSPCAMGAWPATFYLLTLAYLRWQPRRGVAWIIGLAWPLLITPICFLLFPAWRDAPAFRAISGYAPLAGWILAILACGAMLGYQRLHTPRPRRRNEIDYWVLIWAFLAVGQAGYFWNKGITRDAGIAIATLVGVLMCYAALRPDLADLKHLLRRVSGYLVVTLITVIVYFAAISVLQVSASRLPAPFSRLIGVSIAAIALTVLYQPLYQFVQKTIDRLVWGAGYDNYVALSDYGQHIEGLTDLEELAVKAVTLIAHAFGAERGAMINVERKEEEGLTLRAVPGMGVIGAFPLGVSRSHPVIKYLEETSAPLRQRDLERSLEFRAIPERDQEWFAFLNMSVYVPVKSEDKLIGIIALGPKREGAPYLRSELELLASLGEQTALPLRNAQRFIELSNMNANMARLNEDLRRLDEAKSNFLTIASHELKTPLTLIQGYTNILTSLPAVDLQNGDKIAHITEGISRGTERLRQIIDDMIDISRIDANALDLHWRECRLGQIMGPAIAQLAPIAQERQQRLEVGDLEGLPPFEGDPQRLHQAFHNIIENAIKFTPDGGRISISARLLGGDEPAEQFIEVIIADTGIGIALEDQERIFTKFFRVGDVSLHSSSRVQFKGGGPGLGLAITKGIIEAHGGKIWVASEGHDEDNPPGSEFHVLLMLRAPQSLKRDLLHEYGGPSAPEDRPAP